MKGVEPFYKFNRPFYCGEITPTPLVHEREKYEKIHSNNMPCYGGY